MEKMNDFTYYNAIYLDTHPSERVEMVYIDKSIFMKTDEGECDWEYILDEIKRYHTLNGDLPEEKDEDDEFNELCYQTLDDCNAYLINAKKEDILTMINCFNLIILYSKKLSAYVLFTPLKMTYNGMKEVKHYAISKDYPKFLDEKFNIPLKKPTEEQIKALCCPLKYKEIPEFF